MSQRLDVYLFEELAKDCHQLEKDFIESLIQQNYCNVLDNELIKEILRDIHFDDNDIDLSSIESKYDLKRDTILRIILYFGISCLQLYTFDNFLSFIENDTHFDNCLQFVKELDLKYDYSLTSDGQQCYPMARNVALLKLSRLAFNKIKPHLTDDNVVHVLWRMRSAIIHQISVINASNSLFQEILLDSKTIEEFILNNETIGLSLKIDLLNELLNAFLWFGDIERIKANLESAQQMSGLTIGLSGALGLRTQYQQTAVPQLMVKINRTSNDLNGCSQALEVNSDLPKNVALNDDTLLNSIKFVSLEDNANNETMDLTETEQILMLSYIKCYQRIGSPSDELLSEQLDSYLAFLISKTRIWSVLTNCLLMRSLLEKDKRRRVERSMSQINELVDCVRESHLNSVQTIQRSQHFYSVLPNPFWITERYLANVLVSLGVNKSALDIYLRLNLWDDVIDCYQRIGRRDKAEAIIRDQLKDKETPLLYCLLGDTTDDLEYYEKALQLSDRKFPRAHKALGNYYFNLKQYSESIPHFQQSVAFNSMQIDVWFRLAFAAMSTEDYELAATAYRRVVQFETNSFEAWNNLSKAYIKLGQKFRSWKTLQEAIKCSYDEWKIWDNYIAVCVDIGAFAEAIQSWHRLIDIKNQYIDDKIAGILVNAICEGIVDRNGESTAKLAVKMQELFGRIAATSSGSTTIWRLYAKLLINNKEKDIEKVIQCLQKCHRNAVQTNDWQKDPKLIVETLKHCLLLADEYHECAVLDTTKALRVLSSSKLAINSVVVLVEKTRGDWSQSDSHEDIESLLKECENKLQFICDKINEINN